MQQRATALRAPEATTVAAAEEAAIRRVALLRMRVALTLSGALLVIYLGFMALVAFNKQALAVPLRDGVTVAIVAAVGGILAAWLLAAGYVVWANTVHDAACDRIASGRPQ